MDGSRRGSFALPVPRQTQAQHQRIDTGNTGNQLLSSDSGATQEENEQLQNGVGRLFWRRGEGQNQSRQTATGPQDEESRAIREAARQRLAEQRKREWEVVRLQQLRIRLRQEEEEEREVRRVETIQLQEGIHRHQQPEVQLQLGEEHRRQNVERLRYQEREQAGRAQSDEVREWLERHRQRQEEEVRRKQEKVQQRQEKAWQRQEMRRRQEQEEHISQRRQRARGERQEQESSIPRYRFCSHGQAIGRKRLKVHA